MDQHSNLKFVRALAPVAAVTDNTPFVSEILDTANFAANELLIQLGALTDVNATFAVLIEDGDAAALGDAAAVVDAELLGTEVLAGFTYANDNETRKIGYIGHKRYLRATITPTGNDSGNIFLSATWIQGHPRNAPQT
jgi:hypothetical protein